MTTINLQVGASTDDAQEAQDGSGYNDAGSTLSVYANTAAGSRYTVGGRFTSVTIPAFSTIDSATPSINVLSTALDDFNVDIHADDVDDSATFSSGDTPHDRTKTTASVAWVEDATGTGFQAPADDCSAVVQEIIDRAGWASGNDLSILWVGKSDVNKQALCQSYDAGSSLAPKLDIDYTGPHPWGGAGGVMLKLDGLGTPSQKTWTSMP